MHKICFTINLFHASTCFEHHVFESWNKFIVKQILCIKLVNYEDKYTEMHGQQNIKICKSDGGTPLMHITDVHSVGVWWTSGKRVCLFQ